MEQETYAQATIYSPEVLLRFLDKVEQGSNGCLEWTGYLTDGYGNISIGSREEQKKIRAHRWALGFSLGGIEIPTEVFVCHKCDNRKCIAPDHLFPGDHQANMDDMVEKGRSVVVKNGKLSIEQIKDIKYGSGSLSQAAAKHGIVKSTASYIRNGRTWPEI